MSETRLRANVTAILHALELDVRSGGVGDADGLIEGRRGCGDAQDTAARGDDDIAHQFSAGVKDFNTIITH